MNTELARELSSLREAGLYRIMRTIDSSPAKTITVNGESFLNLSSNNYLGLATHPRVKAAACAAIERYGTGGTSSRLVAGTLDLHVQLEEKLAALKRAEAALVFPSGFQTNTGILSTLLSEGDCLIMDRLNHASLWDGAKLSKARVFVYAHRDMSALEKVLQRTKHYRRKLIVTDSVFSMDGDCAPLMDIVSLAQRYGALTMIDEAHATGVFGEHGGGLAEQCGVEGKIDIVMGTLSKALGSQGAFVCGSKEFINYLVNRCRSFIYTTALSPASTGAALAALEVVRDEPNRRIKLLELSMRLRSALHTAGFDPLASQSQIVPCKVGPLNNTLKLSEYLFAHHIFAPAIRPPTVPEGECRLRFSLTSDHDENDVALLLNCIKNKGEEPHA